MAEEVKIRYNRVKVGEGATFDNEPKTPAHPKFKGNIEFEEDIPAGTRLEVSIWVNEAKQDGKKLKRGDKYLKLHASKLVPQAEGEAVEQVEVF
jgi:hypothetical protein